MNSKKVQDVNAFCYQNFFRYETKTMQGVVVVNASGVLPSDEHD